MEEEEVLDEKWLVEEFGKALGGMEEEIKNSVSIILSRGCVQEVSELLKNGDVSESDEVFLSFIARAVFFTIPSLPVAMDFVKKDEKLKKRYDKMRRLFNLYGKRYLAFAVEQEIEDIKLFNMMVNGGKDDESKEG
jgi:hypothetical protein